MTDNDAIQQVYAEITSLHVWQEAARLTPEQEQQLTEAHTALLLSMPQLHEDRQSQTALLSSTWPNADCMAQSLVSLSKVCLLHANLPWTYIPTRMAFITVTAVWAGCCTACAVRSVHAW